MLMLAICAIAFSCNRNEEDQPSRRDRNMVKEEMTWALDSTLVIYNPNTPQEQRIMLHKEDGMFTWSYSFFPYKYQFPTNLTGVNVMSGETFHYADKYPEAYCKYARLDSDGSFTAGGYICFYKDDLFMFRGTKINGELDTRVVIANTDWNAPVWTITYNPVEDDDVVYEQRVEYYSRVK